MERVTGEKKEEEPEGVYIFVTFSKRDIRREKRWIDRDLSLRSILDRDRLGFSIAGQGVAKAGRKGWRDPNLFSA